MSQDANKIKFNLVTNNPGSGTDSNDLKNCYLLPTNQSNQYVFFNSDDLPLVTSPMPVVGGSAFSFSLDGYTWYIPDPQNTTNGFVITGTGAQARASGTWRNNDTSGHALTDDPNGESGTFQAAAGGTVEPEDTASAAKA